MTSPTVTRKGSTSSARLLDELRPDTVLTFGPDGITYHPDHIAVGRWATGAWQRRGRPCRLLYATPSAEHLARFGAVYEEWGVYMSDERPRGVSAERLALRISLDGPDLDRKLTALAAMASQTAGRDGGARSRPLCLDGCRGGVRRRRDLPW